VFNRLSDFLPKLQAANQKLEQQLQSGEATPGDLDIENVEEGGDEEKPVIEMVGGLWCVLCVLRRRKSMSVDVAAAAAAAGSPWFACVHPPHVTVVPNYPNPACPSAPHRISKHHHPQQDLACGLFDIKDDKALAAAERAIESGALVQAADGSDSDSDSSSSGGGGDSGGGEEGGDANMAEVVEEGDGGALAGGAGAAAGNTTQQQQAGKRRRRPLIQEVPPTPPSSAS